MWLLNGLSFSSTQIFKLQSCHVKSQLLVPGFSYSFTKFILKLKTIGDSFEEIKILEIVFSSVQVYVHYNGLATYFVRAKQFEEKWNW